MPSTSSDTSVSIALATYNGAPFLRRQLDSLAAQTLRPAELVVGDDRSSDATTAILDDFAARAPFPVRVTVNAGTLHYGENFLRTAARCEGRFIAFCDQDDLWHPEKLARCVEAMRAADASLCGHDAWLIDAEDRRLGRFGSLAQGVYPPLTLAPWNVFFGFTTTIRRDLLDALPAAARGRDHIDPARLLAHDRWAYFLGTTLARTVYLGEPLADYRQHGRNTFGAGRASPLARLRTLLTTDVGASALHHEIAGSRRALLEDVAPGPYANAAPAGAAYWGHLETIYAERLALARARSLAGRAASLRRLLRLGAYAPPARGGLSLRALAKDGLTAAVPLRVWPAGATP